MTAALAEAPRCCDVGGYHYYPLTLGDDNPSSWFCIHCGAFRHDCRYT